MSSKSILVIDDSNDLRETVSDYLLDQGYDVHQASCPVEAFELLNKQKVDMIICDLNMPFTNGPESKDYLFSHEVGLRTINELSGVYPETPIICMSAATQDYLGRLSQDLRTYAAVSKPFSLKKLRSMVEDAFTGSLPSLH